jgi:hypothetical protein
MRWLDHRRTVRPESISDRRIGRSLIFSFFRANACSQN